MVLKLFDGNGEDNNVNLSAIKINEEFARRFEHNKKREDLQRYEELKKKGQIEDSESESESESSDEEEDPSIANRSRKHDIEFFKVLNQVRKQDPRIYQKDVNFFEQNSDSDDEEEVEEVKKKKKKHEHLKDVQARTLLEEGPEFDDDELNVEKKSYNEEQEELKKAFLYAVKDGEDDDEGDFLKVKDKSEKQENDDYDDDGDIGEKFEENFRKEEQLDENSKFLKEFFMKKMWIDKEGKDKTSFMDDDDMNELMKDEEEIEKQEKYEESYNFRHEEGVGDRVMGHSRKVEGSVRKKDNARKEQRKSKEERQKTAEMERREELKRLKNLKKKEMQEKMKRVLEAAGINDEDNCHLDLNDLEGEFDPEEYDKMMKKAFGQKYYETEDVDPSFGDSDDDEGDIEKPDFDKENELLGLPKGWDEPEKGDGFLAARDRVLKLKAENVDEHDEQSVEAEDYREENGDESGRKRKRKISLFKKIKEELMDEYYKLDYEDTIGDLKTRFKYAKVDPRKYGLKTEDILSLDDKELNQHVSIKKLAPYVEKEWIVPKNKIHAFKKSKQLMVKQNNSNTYKRKQRPNHIQDKSALVSDSDQGRKAKTEESNVVGKLSKSAKRRRRQATAKMSNSRLLLYGKNDEKAKGKGKKL